MESCKKTDSPGTAAIDQKLLILPRSDFRIGVHERLRQAISCIGTTETGRFLGLGLSRLL